MPPSSPVSISACIVSYCDYEEVCAAVRSILQHTPGQLDLYVVDNASPDGCGARLAGTDFADGRVQVICLPRNLGFGGGHNSVLPRLESQVHFILNPDILVQDDILHDLAGWLLDHPDIAMATPQLYFPDGRIQHLPRRKPTPWALFARQLAPKLPGSVFDKTDRHYTMQDEDLTKPRPIEFCTGSFMAVRTEVLRQIGGFDESYFMYVEDADITRKAQALGKVMYAPVTAVTHAWHRDANRKWKNCWTQVSSMLHYWRKWGFRFV